MEKIPSELPVMSVHKGTKLPQEKIEQVVHQFIHTEPELGDAVSLEKTLEQKKMIVDLVENQAQWLEERLGLSAREKVQALEGLEGRVSFFHAEDWEKIREANPNVLPDRTPLALTLSPVNVVLLKETDQSKQKSLLNHEIAHILSRQSLRLRVTATGVLGQQKLFGFLNSRKNRFNYFNEIVTESINLETQVFQHVKDPNSLAVSVGPEYKHGVIWLNMVIAEMARREHCTPYDIRLKLYKSYFTGETSILKIINRAFGRDALNELGKLPDGVEDDVGFLRKIGEELFGIDGVEFDRRVRAFDSNQGFEMSHIAIAPR